ncbi:acyl-CoA dehydrogenase family protein [Gordonia terrae]
MTISLTAPTPEALFAAAESVAPTAGRNAHEARDLRRQPDESVQALLDAGLATMSLPSVLGGSQASTTVQSQVMARIAEEDGSLAWVVSIYNAVGHMVCAFGDQAIDEFLASEKPRSAGVFGIGGRFTEVEGGFKLSGGWGFASGQHHAGWIIVPGVPETGGAPVAFLVPKSEFTVKDDWTVTGLIGTGSNTVLLTDVFVPSHRAIPFMDIVTGDYRNGRLDGDAYYSRPFVPFMCAMSVGPSIGLGRAALKLFEDRIASRGITYTTYEKQSEAPLTHFQLAEARMKLDQAEFHAHRLTTIVDEKAELGQPWTIEERARCRADIAWAVKLVREACEVIEHGSGASATRDKDKLAAILRDIRTMSVHSFLLHSTNSELYGRVLATGDPGVPFV